MQIRSIKRRAFTLVELLVVIAIIGLLSTVAVVSLSSARAKARNTKRVADIKQLINAFNLGVSANGSLPLTSDNSWYCASSSCGGGWGSFPANGTLDSFLSPYLSVKPSDPPENGARTASGYVYDGAWTGGSGFSAGSYLSYMLEQPASCGPGSVWAAGGTSTQLQCLFKLD